MPRISYTEKCEVAGCNKYVHAKYMCQNHYRKMARDGNVEWKRRQNGRGRADHAHIRLAEEALGKKLPPGAVVHHTDGRHWNDKKHNLVICPSQSYHMMLHQRQKKLGITFPEPL